MGAEVLGTEDRARRLRRGLDYRNVRSRRWRKLPAGVGREPA